MMSRSFTRREKILLLILCALLLGILYYQFIYKTSEATIAKYDTADLEIELQSEQAKAANIKKMQAEIDANVNSNSGVVPSYNNIKNELATLNDIFSGVSDYNLEFGQPTVEGDAVRRVVNVTFNSSSYSNATAIVKRIHDCKYRCLIRTLSISGSEGENESNVSVSMEVTFYETMVNANSTDGLEVSKDETKTTESQTTSTEQ